MKLGIDVPTLGKAKLIARLAALKTTTHVQDGGAYVQDMSCSQILIDTDWNEEQLETWLYNAKGVDYIGTFVVDAESEAT